jgi:hypothetical protein
MTTISSATGITSALNTTYKQLNALKAASGSLASGSSNSGSSSSGASNSTVASAIKSANASNRVATLLGTASSSTGSSANSLLSTGTSSDATAMAQTITALYTAGNKRVASLQEQFAGATASNMTDAQKAALSTLMRQALTSQSQSLIALSA